MRKPFPSRVLPALLILLISCLTSVPCASADSVRAKCPDLEKCALATAELTGQKYVFYPNEVRGGPIQSSANYELTKENAEEIFTQLLDQNGFTRVPLSEPGSFTILRQRDARDSALPFLRADVKTTPDFPKAWDLATLHYHVTQPGMTENLARTARSFLPPSSRIIPYEVSGQLIIIASFPILANVLRTIQSLDVKVGPEALKKFEEQAQERKDSERRAAAVKNGGENPVPATTPASQH